MIGRSIPGEHRRKRVRKGTKSCCECKRRKIKCIPSQDLSICAGCIERSTPCLSQEYVDDNSPHTQDSALAQRVARVESLLETLLESAPWTQISESNLPFTPETPNESRHALAPRPTSSGLQPGVGPAVGKLEILRRRLAGMLPCQADVDCLFASSHGWWLIQQHMMPHLPDIPENDLEGLFNVSSITEENPMTIVRLLLCIAICIQQLPSEMDMLHLQTPLPLQEMRSGIIEFIVRNVNSDDELTGSIEGVECLALQGIYEVNAGNLRRSWLSFRKAIGVAQLLGLHRVAVRRLQDGLTWMETRRHHLWYQISRGERYLSTLLGVPSATGSIALPFDDNAVWLSPEDLYHYHLYHISGLILARNQEDRTHSFSTTQRIGEKLESLADRMPPTWWEIPTSIPNKRTKEASAEFERIMCQIWHFELETLVHLPFMLRAATDRRYEYSHISCLEASRNIIKRWMIIREDHQKLLFSNLLEFQAFTAATTLLLGLLSPLKGRTQDVLQERHEDAQLVEKVVQIFERLKTHGAGMSVGTQSISAIRTLQQVLHGERQSGRLRLEIPFFGTIGIASGGAIQSLEGERILGANSFQTASPLLPEQSTTSPSMTSTDLAPDLMCRSRIQIPQDMDGNEPAHAGNNVGGTDTVLQLSGGHFQLPEPPGIQSDLDINEWHFEESDMVFFDSLVNTDLVGNWTL